MKATGFKDKNGVEIYEGDFICYWIQFTAFIAFPFRNIPVYCKDEKFIVTDDFGDHDLNQLKNILIIGDIYDT